MLAHFVALARHIVSTWHFQLYTTGIGLYCRGTGYVVGNGSGRTFWSKRVQKHVFRIRTEGDTAVLSLKQLYPVQKTCFLAHFEWQVRPDTLPQLANMSSQIFGKVITNSSSILVQL